MKFSKKLFLVGITHLFIFQACVKEDPVVPNQEELITTLKYTLMPVGGGNTVELSYKDADGEGGMAPVIKGGTLAANRNYTGKLSILNESVSPVDDISLEIISESDAHQFFFEKKGGLNLSISYSDKDPKNFPLGIETSLLTGNASSGQLVITLRHEPNKSAVGVATGDKTNAGGETDIEVTFDVKVE